MAGTSVTRTAGVNGTFQYTLSVVPFGTPVLTIYSDAARTVVAVAAAALTPTANPSVFTAAYPASLPAGTYYLSFSTVITNGQPATIDQDDMLVLVSAGGSVNDVYATIQDVRDLGITTVQRSDTLVGVDLDVASRMIDQITGKQFYQAVMTVSVFDVRLPIVFLPTPFTNVTAVTVDGRTVDPTVWKVVPGGLRMYLNAYIDEDGFPRRSYTDVRAFRNPYGATVAVTGTFGYATIPSPIARATALVAARAALANPNNQPDPRVSLLNVEGYERRFDLTKVGKGTLGDVDADRLVWPFVRRTALVG